MADTQLVLDVQHLIDRQAMRGFHWLVLGLCALAMFLDGLDTMALGFLAPRITADLHLHAGALGLAFGAGSFGSMAGALACTPLADRFGRKPTILISLLIFALGSLATSHATSLTSLAVIRAITGIGLGSVMPNSLAMTAEYMPARYRVTLVMIVWFGFSLGSAAAGPACAALLAVTDWRTIFLIGAAIPVVIAPIMAWLMPESLQSLMRQGAAPARVDALARRVDPALPAGGFVLTVQPEEKGFPVALLFREGRAPLTSILWLMFFMNLAALFFLNSWLPTVLRNAGLSETAALSIGGLTHIGGILGGFVIAAICDRFDRYRVLAIGYALAAFSIVTIGLAGNVLVAATAAVFFAGFFVNGGQNAANAIATVTYPSSMRSSGIGWAIGIGRIGTILGPVLGGMLMAWHWGNVQILAMLACFCLVACLAALALREVAVRRKLWT